MTNSLVTVHGVLAQVIGDCPALAKIGMHNGPSSYFSCHRCGFKGVICGHDQTLAEPARYDNVNFNPSFMKEIDRETLSGSIRKKSKSEHIVWLDTDLVKRENLREDCSVLSDQFRVWDKLNSATTMNWAESRMRKWTSKFRVNGLSPLVHVPHLSLVHDLTTESMHFFIKGILLQLAELTFSQSTTKGLTTSTEVLMSPTPSWSGCSASSYLWVFTLNKHYPDTCISQKQSRCIHF